MISETVTPLSSCVLEPAINVDSMEILYCLKEGGSSLDVLESTDINSSNFAFMFSSNSFDSYINAIKALEFRHILSLNYL